MSSFQRRHQQQCFQNKHLNDWYLGEYVDINEVEKVPLGALNLFLQAVHPLVLHVQHIFSWKEVKTTKNWLIYLTSKLPIENPFLVTTISTLVTKKNFESRGSCRPLPVFHMETPSNIKEPETSKNGKRKVTECNHVLRALWRA